MKYEITLRQATTDCRIASHAGLVAPNLDECATTKIEICNVTVWEQLWLIPQRQLLDMNCEIAKNSPKGLCIDIYIYIYIYTEYYYFYFIIQQISEIFDPI